MHKTHVAIEKVATGLQLTVNGMCHHVTDGKNNGTLYLLTRTEEYPKYPLRLVLLVSKDGDSYDVTEYSQNGGAYRINAKRPHSLLSYTGMAKQYSGYTVHEIIVATVCYHAHDTQPEPIKLYQILTLDNFNGETVFFPRDSNGNYSICPVVMPGLGAYKTMFFGYSANISKI